MEPNLFQILLLGIVQGAAELLPVSSSAHVIVTEKLLGLDPSSPSMTFLLVMLHTGTMVAVIIYFWKAWQETFFRDASGLRNLCVHVGTATGATLIVGLGLTLIIEKIFLHGASHHELEDLFGHLPIVGSALFAAGVLILITGLLPQGKGVKEIGFLPSLWIGASQGLCLPFRGLSRSGTTISTGMLLGCRPRRRVEEFSFALAVVITPPAIAKEFHRLVAFHGASGEQVPWNHLLIPGLLGMGAAFVAGLLALKLLSHWLEKGHWSWFGYYCVAFSGFVFFLASRGY